MSIPVRVAIVNYSCSPDDEAVTSGITALQAQVSDHLAPAWCVDAELFRLEPPTPCAGAFGLILRDGGPDDSLAEATTTGLPLAHVFLGDLAPGQHWTHAASRELLNLLVNPIVSRMAYRRTGDGADQRHRLYVHDVVAPCAGYDHGYEVGGWRVSDFVHEAWFTDDLPASRPRFDREHRIHQPFGVLPGERVFAYDLVQDAWLCIAADERTGALTEAPGRPTGARARRLVQMMSDSRRRIHDRERCGSGKNPDGAVMGGP
jgi:hypothetical protein